MALDESELKGPLTFEEYLELEEASPVKHELVGGYMYEYDAGESRGLAGATRQHNRIAGNIFAHLWNAAGGGPCEVYGSDMRLRVNDSTTYYPDLQVVCDADDSDQMFTRRPCLVVEVLSPSTADVDRREKLLAYQSLESLRAYLIVWTDQRRCMLHSRDVDGRWSSSLSGPDGEVGLSCPSLRLGLDEIYAGVELKP